jgi:ComF family protein
MQVVLQGLKYRKMTHVAGDLATVLAGCAGAHFGDAGIDAVECVPLHRRRFRQRTFNQSALLAAGVALRMGLPVLDGGLTRTRDTGTQTRMNATMRSKNVRGAFEVRDPAVVEGRRILLVDDVMTTGATVSECSRALDEAGAADVYVLTVARG